MAILQTKCGLPEDLAILQSKCGLPEYLVISYSANINIDGFDA